jgi:hypothetical protein
VGCAGRDKPLPLPLLFFEGGDHMDVFCSVAFFCCILAKGIFLSIRVSACKDGREKMATLLLIPRAYKRRLSPYGKHICIST